jgi:histidinol dehydrogenase
MLVNIVWKNLNKNEQSAILKRPLQKSKEGLNSIVRDIIKSVREQGDLACKQFTQKFDGVNIENLLVTTEEVEEARKRVNNKSIMAMKKVINQISQYHLPQKINNYTVETAPGVVCKNITRPIQRVGLYIPGGTAPLVSTTLMLGVPSNIAGCPLRILCSPPGSDGSIDPNILMAAELCGIKQIFKLGGAQAIAAMSYGTESIPKVDKIFGPGNSFVTQAKILVAQEEGGAMYDLPAGPSEVMVIADDGANPDFIAADLLAQAEHGSDSQVILVCTDAGIGEKVSAAIEVQINNLSRKSIIQSALQNSCIIVVEEMRDAIEIVNRYAPEHLILQVDQSEKYLEQIQSVGSIFLGSWSPVTAGDYASGTTHVLPTAGCANQLSGLSVRDFMKTISVQRLTKSGLAGISDEITVLSGIEGLDAHQQAVQIRLRGEAYE